MGKKVLAAKSGRAACSCAAAGGGIAAKNAKSAKRTVEKVILLAWSVFMLIFDL